MSFSGLKLGENYHKRAPHLGKNTTSPYPYTSSKQPFEKPSKLPKKIHLHASIPGIHSELELVPSSSQFIPKSWLSSKYPDDQKYRDLIRKQVQTYMRDHTKCQSICDHLKKFYQRLAVLFENLRKEQGRAMKISTLKIDKIQETFQNNDMSSRSQAKLNPHNKHQQGRGYLIDINQAKRVSRSVERLADTQMVKNMSLTNIKFQNRR